MRKIIIYISSFLLILVAFPSNSMANGDDIFKKGKNISPKKGNFHKDKKFGSRGCGSKGVLTPPDPGDGGGGNPIPIGNGLGILLVLSGIYLTRKIKKDIKK